jgi:hypothetical protein
MEKHQFAVIDCMQESFKPGHFFVSSTHATIEAAENARKEYNRYSFCGADRAGLMFRLEGFDADICRRQVKSRLMDEISDKALIFQTMQRYNFIEFDEALLNPGWFSFVF